MMCFSVDGNAHSLRVDYKGIDEENFEAQLLAELRAVDTEQNEDLEFCILADSWDYIVETARDYVGKWNREDGECNYTLTIDDDEYFYE